LVVGSAARTVDRAGVEIAGVSINESTLRIAGIRSDIAKHNADTARGMPKSTVPTALSGKRF
jgi:hypothetical protein